MTPTLITSDEHLAILEALKPLEPLIYVANAGASREHFEALLAPEFWEIAASGKRYSREYVINTLEERQQKPFKQAWHTSDYFLQPLANQFFLLTYTLHQPTRISQRTSLWRSVGDTWQLVYHQGTVA